MARAQIVSAESSAVINKPVEDVLAFVSGPTNEYPAAHTVWAATEHTRKHIETQSQASDPGAIKERRRRIWTSDDYARSGTTRRIK